MFKIGEVIMAILRRFGKIKEAEDQEVLKHFRDKGRISDEDSSATPRLLDLVARAELSGGRESSVSNNYNAYYANAGNTEIDFTKMTIREVREWQDKYISGGSPSSAVGRYQIIRKTLDSLIDELDLTGSEYFDSKMQDKMGETLLKRRGYDKFKTGKMSKEDFANNLAKEWASFPVIGGDKDGYSYYAGVANNKAHIKTDHVLAALDNELKLINREIV